MTKKFLLLLAAAVSTGCAAFAQPDETPTKFRFYATPAAVVAVPGDFDTTAGGSLALGFTYNGVHSFEGRVICFESDDHGFDVDFLPVLAIYKYRMPLTGRWSAELGAAVGSTAEHTGPWVYGRNTHAFTAGALASVSYPLAEHAEFVADVLALRLEDTSLTTDGHMTIVTVGLKFHF